MRAKFTITTISGIEDSYELRVNFGGVDIYKSTMISKNYGFERTPNKRIKLLLMSNIMHSIEKSLREELDV